MESKKQCWRTIVGSALLFSLLSCGNSVLETNLDGFDQGKKTMKLEFRVDRTQHGNGRKGYRIETLVHRAIGTKSIRKTQRNALLNDDFSLIKSEMTRQVDSQITTYHTEVKGGRIAIDIVKPNQEKETHEIEHVGPVFVELHPLCYTRDLKNPGDAKSYPILLEDDGRIVSVNVKFLGPEKFFENGRSFEGNHFQIQAATNPSEFDDYFIDPKTHNILKINFGLIKFLPAS